DLRKLAGIDSGACGVFIGAASAELPIEPNSSIWDDAALIGASLSAARAPDAARAFITQVSTEFLPTAGVDKFHAFFSAGEQSDLVISNLGVLPLETRYGDNVVKAVWAPAMLTNLPKDRQTLGISTFGGRLRIIHQSYVPIPNFAAAIRNGLIFLT